MVFFRRQNVRKGCIFGSSKISCCLNENNETKHILFTYDKQLVLSGNPCGLQVRVCEGTGTGRAWRTHGLPALFTICIASLLTLRTMLLVPLLFPFLLFLFDTVNQLVYGKFFLFLPRSIAERVPPVMKVTFLDVIRLEPHFPVCYNLSSLLLSSTYNIALQIS